MADRTVLVRLRANASQFEREMLRARTSVAALNDRIDKTNDRTAWLAQGLLALAPAAVTAGATAIPVLVGMATQATLSAAAIGTGALAFVGLGDAVGALNEYQLEPTTKNLEKLNEELRKMGPDGAEFVQVLDQVGEKLSVLQLDARAGMFPGMGEGLLALLDRLPQLRMVVTEVARGMGQLSAEAGRSLAGSDWDAFFGYLETDAKPLLLDMGRILGNLVDGFGEMLVAFSPLTREFSTGLLEMSRGFEAWAAGLSETQGFSEFTQYVRDNGPDVLQMLGSFSTAMIELTKAAAPVGAVAVPMLELLADSVALIADTPFGSFLILGAAITSLIGRLAALRAIAGGPLMMPFTKSVGDSTRAARAAIPTMSQLGRVMAYTGQATKYASKETLAARSALHGFARAAAPAAASVGLLAVAMSPLPEKAGLTNTAMGAMMGMMAGPWGVAAGATIGALLDLSKGADGLRDAVDGANTAMAHGSLEQMRGALARVNDELDKTRSNDVFGINVGDGLGDFLNQLMPLANISKTMGFLTGETNRAERAQGELTREIEGLESVSARVAADERLATRLREDAQAATGAADEFRDLGEAYEAPTLQLEELLNQMRDWGRAAADMGSNIQTALANGVDPAALNELIDRLGPAAGLALEELADGGVDAARRLNRSWGDYEDRLHDLEGAVGDVRDEMRDMPTPTLDVNDGNLRKKLRDALDEVGVLDAAEANPFASMNVKPLLEAAGKADRRMGETSKKGPKPSIILLGVPQTIAELNNLTRPRVVPVRVSVSSANAVEDAIRRKGKGSADGSTVPNDGGGYRDYLPYLLAPLEEVISNRHGQADQFRPELKDINAGLTRAEVFERMLTRGLANGGTAGLAGGGTANDRKDGKAKASTARTWIPFGVEVPDSLKGLAKALRVSEKALENETRKRDENTQRMQQLSESVSGLLTSDLFGETDPWTNGSAFNDVMATLTNDTRGAQQFSRDIADLKKKGLDGPALEALLANADKSTVSAWADLKPTQLAAFENSFNHRAGAIARSGRDASVAAFGEVGKRLEAKVATLTGEVKVLQAITKDAGKESTRAQRRGASNGRRNTKKG